MTIAVRAESITKTFNGSQKALDQVNLSVNHGEVLVVMGPSGSGKSTLIRTFNGLEAIDAGQLEIVGILWIPIRMNGRSDGFAVVSGWCSNNSTCSRTCRSSTTSRWHRSE